MLPFRLTVRGRKLSPVILDRWHFFPNDIFFHQLTKKTFPTFFLPPIGPRGVSHASAVFRSCIPGNVRTFRFLAGEILQPIFFFSTGNFFFPTNIFFFEPTKILCSNGHLFSPSGLGGCFPPLPFFSEISPSPNPKYH